ncbi:hypothetical protein JST99_00370 [Candidatus Dependentiae bacterium]|nr:hypothetical protein [Candidatus Dependentiae bacterium]
MISKEIVGLASLAYFGFHVVFNRLKTRSNQEVTEANLELMSHMDERTKYVKEDLFEKSLLGKREPSQPSSNDLNKRFNEKQRRWEFFPYMNLCQRYDVVIVKKEPSQPPSNDLPKVLNYNEFFLQLRCHDLLLPHEYGGISDSTKLSDLQITSAYLDGLYTNSIFRPLDTSTITNFKNTMEQLKAKNSASLRAKDRQEQLNRSSEALRKAAFLTVATGIIAHVGFNAYAAGSAHRS